MPAETKEAVRRTWELLKLVPQWHPGKTVAKLQSELATAGFTISARQVERDLTSLSRLFPLVSEESSKPYHWSWMKDSDAGLPAVALTEAVALVVVEETLKGMVHKSLLAPLATRLAAARALLGGAWAGSRAAGYAKKVRTIPRELVLHAPAFKPEVMQRVTEALLANEQLDILYQSLQDKEPRWRCINPRALLLKGPVIYLLANEFVEGIPEAKSIIKQYALHRFRTCRRKKTLAPSRAFNLSSYIKAQEHEPGDRRVLRVTLKVNAYLASILRETQLSVQQRMKPVGEDFLVEAAARDTNALRRWILGHGRAVEVLAPASLRKTIADHVKAAAAKY